MFREIITIEDLVKENEKLKVSRKKVEDKKDFQNSKISTKISKYNAYITALNDKALRNDEICENKLAQIDRLIKENEETIKVKAGIGNDIADKITKKNLKIERKQCTIGRKGE